VRQAASVADTYTSQRLVLTSSTTRILIVVAGFLIAVVVVASRGGARLHWLSDCRVESKWGLAAQHFSELASSEIKVLNE
jgi:hypothetical protein